MNRRTLIIVTAVVAVGLFAIGGLLYSPTSKEVAVTKPVSNEAPLVRPHSPVFGAKDAPVTIVEFFDPACEACRAFHPVVKKILSEFQGKVRVVLRYTPFHGEASEQAIRKLLLTSNIMQILPFFILFNIIFSYEFLIKLPHACLICFSSPIIKAFFLGSSRSIDTSVYDGMSGFMYSKIILNKFIFFSLGEGILAKDENSLTK